MLLSRSSYPSPSSILVFSIDKFHRLRPVRAVMERKATAKTIKIFPLIDPIRNNLGIAAATAPNGVVDGIFIVISPAGYGHLCSF